MYVPYVFGESSTAEGWGLIVFISILALVGVPLLLEKIIKRRGKRNK